MLTALARSTGSKSLTTHKRNSEATKQKQQQTNMELGGKQIFCEVDGEVEEIFEDELNDGIANAADEQAVVWLQAIKEGEGNFTEIGRASCRERV